MTFILPGLVPRQVADDCEETSPLNCGKEIISENTDTTYSVEFPRDTSVVPLSGGAILSIRADGLKMRPSRNVANILIRNLSALKGLELTPKIEDLSRSRVAINNALFDIARRDIKVISESGPDKGKKKKAPFVYLSVFKGDDPSVIKEGISNPDMIRVCEFRYIPAESFIKILDNILDETSPSFGDVVGVSGRTYSDLQSYASEINDSIEQASSSFEFPNIDPPSFPSLGGSTADVNDLILEFFPVVNLSNSALSSTSSNPVIGGYYTVLDNVLYIKLPDITGRDSAGTPGGSLTSDSSIWIEVLSGKSLTRTEIDNFKLPPVAAFVGDQETEFPSSSSLEVIFELEEADDVTVYLSPIVKGVSVNGARSIDAFSGEVELFTVPVLTRPVQGSGGLLDTANRLAIINEDSSPSSNEVSGLAQFVDNFYPGFSDSSISPSDSGYPYFGQRDPHIFFGEKNRPDILLTDNGNSVSKNNSRYFNISSYGILNILSSVMPKFYNGVPKEWASSKPTIDSDGNYKAVFSSINFDSINLSSAVHNGSIEYAVYVEDSSGQVTRVNGPHLSLSEATPSIQNISPDGFSGGLPIVIDEVNVIQISGEDLAEVKRVSFTNLSSGAIINISPGDSTPSVMSIPTDSSITLTLDAGDLGARGFVASSEYSIRLHGAGSATVSSEDRVFVASASDDDLPTKSALFVEFSTNEFRSSDFGLEPITGIPLFNNGLSASIGIKSKGKIFDGEKDVYAYIGLPTGEVNTQVLSEFSFPSRTIQLNASGLELLVPLDIEYTFQKAITADFSKIPFSNKKAILKFPGASYSGYNFSSLVNVDKAYIVITNRRLGEVAGSNTTVNLDSDSHGLLEIGSDSDPGFIEPSSIIGMAADISGTVFSTFENSKFDIPSDVFGGQSLTPGTIVTSDNISKIALIVSGTNEKFISKRYRISLGGEDITNKISNKPTVIGRGQILFELSNIRPKNDGILSFTIDKKEKRFGSNYSSVGYTGKSTAIINEAPGSIYSIDEKTGTLIVNEDITSDELVSSVESFISDTSNLFGIVGNSSLSSNVLDSLYPDSPTNGVLFNPANSDKFITNVPFVPIDITPSTKIKLGLSLVSGNTSTLLAGFTESKVNSLARDVLIVGSGASFSSGSYVLNKDGDAALLFFNAITQSLASIKYNVPEVISIAEEGKDPIILSTGKEIPIIVGNKYEIVVDNTDRDFTLMFDSIVIKPRGRPEPVDGVAGRYKATIEAPITLLNISISSETCFDVCASTRNSTRNRAKFELGRDFVVDLDDVFQEMLLGPLKDKIPDVQGLFDKLADAPLKFVSNLLDKANIPKDLIKSFCDLSFHLVAELKISLNGFQVLMVPLQVIFCIIDVICSLLNPVKLARAIIRLFQCLYDLILLLPQISIPVMFFQLILHLLELLKCVIDKILFTITAINEISRALNLAGQKPIDFDAIKALEETLSEYLFEIEADLTFLEPILSILAIFLQLLQLIFRFPCSITPGEGEPDCGVDGTMLAGIVAGIAAPDLSIDPNVMLPVGQTYSNDDLGSTSSSNITESVFGNSVGVESGGTYLESMNLDSDTLRGTSANSGGIDFNVTMAPTFTKSTKNVGKPKQVKFRFNGRGLTTGVNDKNIDPNQTVDTPLAFLSKDGTILKLGEKGNLYSPIDGQAFLNINGDTASVKPLILEFEVPVFGTDPDTGVPMQTGTDLITRTFDNIPKVVIMDDEFNVYFIQKDGIEFDSDGFVETIIADVVNTPSSSKLKFSREEVEIDSDEDGDIDEDDKSIKIFDFPQLYFFDMRQAGDQLEQFCSTASINSFPFEDNNTEDIESIVTDAVDCLDTYLAGVRGQVATIRNAQTLGVLPLPEISVDEFSSLNETVVECLSGTLDDICKYVINGLNTSFKILEDDDETPLEGFVDGDISEDVLEGFDAIGPAFTGAREYAAGIGDSASIAAGGIATIEVIPRDSYDDEIIGDITNRIILEIISDSTGDAEFIKNQDGSILTKTGTAYTAKITSSNIGEVKVRGRVCERTIQALTFDGLQFTELEEDVNCVPNINTDGSLSSSPPLGALTKVDRILSIFFVKVSRVIMSNIDGADELPSTQPQEFGSGLEN